MRNLLGTFPLLMFFWACGEKVPILNIIDVEHASSQNLLVSTKLKQFGSKLAFAKYLDNLYRERQESQNNSHDCTGCNNIAEAMAQPAAAPEASSAMDEGITNNQEQGVDEGGIVKVAGDYFIILRRGRLFSIRSRDNGQDTLESIDAINAFPAYHEDPASTWYDELLVMDDEIIVIGYSYGYDATEISVFKFSEDGKFEYIDTHFLRSSDYYSSRNYASRLVDNKLVFYTPLNFFRLTNKENEKGYELTFPAWSKLLPSGKKSPWQEIIDVSKIYSPIEEDLYPTLHTVTTCDIKNFQFSCSATSVLGPYSRTFYVSQTAVYLWNKGRDEAIGYRLPFDESLAGAIRAMGVPTDQFSFKEDREGYLNVLLRETGYGDAMAAPEHRDSGVALLRLPLAKFSNQIEEMPLDFYHFLPSVKGYNFHNKFIGDHVLYGTGGLWYGDEDKQYHRLTLYQYQNGETSSIDLQHGISRIESLGENAVVIGQRDNDLVFSAIILSDNPLVSDSFSLGNSQQGERRSHGFFFRPLNEQKGILGLPIRKQSNPFGSLLETSASILYLMVDNGNFSSLGQLKTQRKYEVKDGCQASCVDWYGNSRPIFFKDRIFALLGYDLVEAQLLDSALQEIRRIDFAPKIPKDLEP